MVKKPFMENRYRLLYELFHSITSTLDTEKSLNLIIDAAVNITGATNGSLILIDWEKEVLNIKVSRGFVSHIGDVRLRVGEGVTGWVAKTGTPLLVSDVSKEPRYVEVNPDIRSELAVPLILEDRVIGVVNVDSTRVNGFTEEDLDLLTLLSRQAARVIQNGMLYNTTRRKVEELSTLIQLNKTIASTFSLDKILKEIVYRTALLMDSQSCSVLLLSETGNELVLKARYDENNEPHSEQLYPLDSEILKTCFQAKQSLILSGINDTSQFPFQEISGTDFQSMIAVPLIAREEAIGIIVIFKSQAYKFQEDERRLLETFADLCAIAIENARMYERMLTLEEQIRHAERLAAVGELAAGIAHEIRNPLTIVKMLLDAGGTLTEKDRSVIREEIHRMNQIITYLLDYTRSQETSREICDVNKNLENSLLLLSREIDKRNIRIHKEMASGLPPVYANPVQLQQVFLNLLLNAIDAIESHGKIKVSTGEVNSGVEIVIQDNGPGISPEIKKKLFVPFTTSKSKGLGLGLSIVKRIIEAHDGMIQIQSSRSKGTRVKLWLPSGTESQEHPTEKEMVKEN
ncbi:MAG: GAF domain-containing protein [Calditrichaeota bacterium]|nr:MAG: GAF domain-containing protein [Calditrichota bacterium]